MSDPRPPKGERLADLQADDGRALVPLAVEPGGVEVVDPGQAEERESVFRPYTLADLDALPEPEWLVDGILAPGLLTLIVGRPGGGKTFTAFDLMAALAAGQGDFAGRFPVQRPGRSFYMTSEGRSFLRYRLRGAFERHGLPDHCDRVLIAHATPSLTNPDDPKRGVEALAEQIDGLGIDAVFIDTYANAIAPGGDPNDPMTPEAAGIALSALRSRIGRDLAAVIVHHTNKTEGVLGATGLEGNADVIVAVKKDATTGTYRMESRKAKHNVDFPEIEFRLVPSPSERPPAGQQPRIASVEWLGQRNKAAATRDANREAIVEALTEIARGEDNAQPAAVIAKRAEVSEPTVRTHLTKMAREPGFAVHEKRKQRVIDGKPNNDCKHYWIEEVEVQ